MPSLPSTTDRRYVGRPFTWKGLLAQAGTAEGGGRMTYVGQLRARRAAAQRLPVLESGRSDPWWYEPVSVGYENAAMHLLEHGLTPAPNPDGLQAMRKRGGRTFRAAKLIAERWEHSA